MGQYYLTVNLDKGEFIHPHKFGDGLKLMEFGLSGMGTMAALAVLLANGNGRGSGDLHSENEVIGSWAGDRIVVAGDYGDDGKWLEHVPREELQMIAEEVFREGYQEAERVNLYFYARRMFTDVSERALEALNDDTYFASETQGNHA